MNRSWIEFFGDDAEAISLDVSRISTVRRKGTGSVIVCDGQVYEFTAIPYESMLVKCFFFRSTEVDPLGRQGN